MSCKQAGAECKTFIGQFVRVRQAQGQVFQQTERQRKHNSLAMNE